MSALSLSALGGSDWVSGVTNSADHLVASELSGESGEGWLDFDRSSTSSSESQNEMESGFLLDVVIGESSVVFELLSSENESLLIRGNSFFVLNFCSIEISF